MDPIDLSPGEEELLIDGLSDDVAFLWVLIHFGIRENPPATPDWRPTKSDVAAAFASLRKLVDAGVVRVGRLEYADDGPPERVAPVKHVAEEVTEALQRVEKALIVATEARDWESACWVVNTEKGDAIARRALAERGLS
ncbi:MAG: hypothetical protein WEB06_09655 [Actinomycetota bacterium]